MNGDTDEQMSKRPMPQYLKELPTALDLHGVEKEGSMAEKDSAFEIARGMTMTETPLT